MPDIVAVHGFTGCGEDFDVLRPHLPPGSTLIAPDLPGHGARQSWRQAGDYDLSTHLRLITEAIDGRSDCTLLGYSMGGRLALHWALAHPGSLRKLVLIGASPGLTTPEERAERRLADEALARHIRSQGLDAFYKYWHHQPFFRSLFQLPPERLDPILARRRRNDPEGLALSLEQAGTGALPSLWPRLREIRCPVDLVAGEGDPKFALLARQMAEFMPRSRVSIIADAGHAAHLEQPADVAMLLA